MPGLYLPISLYASIIVLYDAKSLSVDLRDNLHKFVKKRSNELQKSFTGYEIIVKLQKGHKDTAVS